MVTHTKHTGVASALRMIVSSRARSNNAWPLIVRVIQDEVRARRVRRDVDDVQQEVCIKLLRMEKMTVATDGAAIAFIRKATRNVIIDRIRRDGTRPQAVQWREGNDPLDRVAEKEDEHDSVDAMEAASAALLDRVLAEVDLRIEQSGKSIVERERSRLQAHARVLARLWGKSSAEIAVELNVPDASSACIQKWVERGLPVLLQAIDAIAHADQVHGEFGDQGLIEKLRVAIAKRRTDAGKPRATRRKAAKEAT